jgi:hypothetical protein
MEVRGKDAISPPMYPDFLLTSETRAIITDDTRIFTMYLSKLLHLRFDYSSCPNCPKYFE